jgi:hypothetical protein
MSGGYDCGSQGSHHMQTSIYSFLNGAAIKRTWALWADQNYVRLHKKVKTKSLRIESEWRDSPSSPVPLHTELTLRRLPHHSGFLFERGAFHNGRKFKFGRVRITRCEGRETECACSILHVTRLCTCPSHNSVCGSSGASTRLKYRAKSYGRKSRMVFGSSLILATSCVSVLWHACSRQALWSQQRQALLGKGSANTPIARQQSPNTKQWSNYEMMFSTRSVR